MSEPASGHARDGHLAVRAWGRLSGGVATPHRVDVLKETKRSSVYRLVLSDPGSPYVIAKRTIRAKGLIEQSIYENVLSRVSLNSVGYHGVVEADDPRFLWLFIEDVGNQRYTPRDENHRRLAAEWLGALHVAVDQEHLTATTNRGPDFYRQHLQSITANLPQLNSDPLPPGGREVLDAILHLCRMLESQWNSLDDFCRSIPRTVIHGDCLPKNIHIRGTGDQSSVAFFDWGNAGIGLAGTDLGLCSLPHEGPPNSDPDFGGYLSVVRQRWMTADLDIAQQMALVGQLFWALEVIDKSRPDFEFPSPYLVENHRLYARAMWRSMAAARWSPFDRAEEVGGLHPLGQLAEVLQP